MRSISAIVLEPTPIRAPPLAPAPAPPSALPRALTAAGACAVAACTLTTGPRALAINCAETAACAAAAASVVAPAPGGAAAAGVASHRERRNWAGPGTEGTADAGGMVTAVAAACSSRSLLS
eukprot:366546-Chlamydomonas_euryale.AAC.14